MPVNISPVNTTNTFQFLIDRVNQLISVANTSALTIGSTATGNTSIAGTLTANTLVANTANVTNFSTTGLTSNSTNLTIAANNVTTSNTNTTTLSISNAAISTTFTTNTTGTSVQPVDWFSLSQFRSAEYILDVRDNTANNFTHSRISILNSGTVMHTEYGILVSNNTIGTFTVTANSTMVILNYQPATSANTTILGTKTVLIK